MEKKKKEKIFEINSSGKRNWSALKKKKRQH